MPGTLRSVVRRAPRCALHSFVLFATVWIIMPFPSMSTALAAGQKAEPRMAVRTSTREPRLHFPSSFVKQSFSHIPGVAPQGVDMRVLAPQKPWDLVSALAMPQSGSDLNSVGQDWMGRQARLLTGDAEERLLASVNQQMTRWLPSLIDPSSPLESEPPAQPTHARAGESAANQELAFLRPTSLRFAQLNRLEMGWTNNLRFGWSATGDTMQFDLSAPLGASSFVDVRHDTLRSLHSLHLKYSW